MKETYFFQFRFRSIFLNFYFSSINEICQCVESILIKFQRLDDSVQYIPFLESHLELLTVLDFVFTTVSILWLLHLPPNLLLVSILALAAQIKKSAAFF